MDHPDPIDEPFEAAQASASRLAERTGVEHHDVALVLGSGWKPAADQMGEIVAEFPMAELGGFPEASVAGHGSTVRSIRSGDRHVLAFMGRVHLYEGHHPNVVVHGVRTAIRSGVRTVVLTNAAGGLRSGMRIGQPVLISDHINLTGRSPLLGPNDDRFGPRFPDMGDVYTARLRELVRSVDPTIEEAVYLGLLGPTYETPAEVRMIDRLGGELVGMSTVLESIAVAHTGTPLLALSLVTNLAAGLDEVVLDHADVLAAAAESAEAVGALLAELVRRLP